jgi:hypothetical protein
MRGMRKALQGSWRARAAPGLALTLHLARAASEEVDAMRKVVAPVVVLLMGLLYAPTAAQALVPAFLSEYLPLTAAEPVGLFLTGIALLSLSRVGAGRSQASEDATETAATVAAPATPYGENVPGERAA